MWCGHPVTPEGAGAMLMWLYHCFKGYARAAATSFFGANPSCSLAQASPPPPAAAQLCRYITCAQRFTDNGPRAPSSAVNSWLTARPTPRHGAMTSKYGVFSETQATKGDVYVDKWKTEQHQTAKGKVRCAGWCPTTAAGFLLACIGHAWGMMCDAGC